MTHQIACPPSTPWRRAAIVAALYATLLVAAVPWYWPEDNHSLWFGMPAWVVVAIGVSIAASLLTGILLSRPWPAEASPGE